MTKNKSIGTVSFFHSRFTSVISIALVLFLVGLILLMGMLGNKLSIYVKENMSFSIVLKDGLKEVEVKKMQKNLEALPYIKSTEYISKERAAAELEDELGENPETFLGFNPLQASIEVKLHSQYANPDSLRLIEDKIKSYTSVSELLYRKDMMELVQNNMERIGIVLLSLIAILMVISFVLISNTIRLLIYSRRFLIHTMQLVGATAGFIRTPFVRYNVISGIFAAVLAICMLTGALYYLQLELAGFIQILAENEGKEHQNAGADQNTAEGAVQRRGDRCDGHTTHQRRNNGAHKQAERGIEFFRHDHHDDDRQGNDKGQQKMNVFHDFLLLKFCL